MGGELFYTYKGVNANNQAVYKVTLRFFRNMQANVPAINFEPVYIGIYQGNTNLVKNITLPFEKVDTIRSTNSTPCIDNSLRSVYEVGYFSAEVALPIVSTEYTLAWIRCCRTNNVQNMNLNDGGITLSAVIPGTDLVGNQPNNSAVFSLRDTILLCKNQYFNLDFSATDADGDRLTYKFYPAIHGASINDPTPDPKSTLTYSPLNYKEPQFTAEQPMGPGVKLDAVSGQISGTAPATGTYLVTVRVYEWRNNQIINQHSKDILIKTKDCAYSTAILKPEYIYCDSTFTFANEFAGNSTDTWFWDFGVTGLTNDTSVLSTPQYNYKAPGVYDVTLIINKHTPCAVSATTKLKVYPGLLSGFTIKDSCVGSVQFTDTSSYSSGLINQWFWDFGDPSSSSNISSVKNPIHRYNTSGIKKIRLITGTDKGCVDTSYHELNVLPLPDLTLSNHAVTICKGDTVQLQSTSSGPFTWSPDANIKDKLSGKPTVYPVATTTYYVTVNDLNCSNKDSVIVTVLPREEAHILNTITQLCAGDTLVLQGTTKASVFEWTPKTNMINDNSPAPSVYPSQTTQYKLIAYPGVCQVADSITITVIEKPTIDAGNDVTINEGQRMQIRASGADNYLWTPALGLNSATVPDPYVSIPMGIDSVIYKVTGWLNNGCYSSDTVSVHVNVTTFVDAPTAFTPNGDGKNDVFRPIVKGAYRLAEFMVYDRWGAIVFKTKEAGKGWDGKAKTAMKETGVYVWVVKAINKRTGEHVSKKGTVVLIR